MATLDELQEKLPESMRPWVAEYAPAFIVMTAEEIKAWVELVIRGDVFEAYQAVVAKLENSALLEQWNALDAHWKAANKANAESIELQRTAALGAVKIMLAIALAAIGL